MDLTIRKSPEPKREVALDLDQEKENLKHDLSPEKMEWEPLIQGSPSPIAPSISPKRKLDDISRSSSPRSSKTPKLTTDKSTSRTSPASELGGPQFDLPPALHPFLLRTGSITNLIPPEVHLFNFSAIQKFIFEVSAPDAIIRSTSTSSSYAPSYSQAGCVQV